MSTPLVAVFMVTYNHEKFVEQAIEGVIMQKTKFPIKLFIGEDCSSDQTANITSRLQMKNKEVVEVLNNKQNLGAFDNAKQIFNICSNSGAKYIALLEGDNYWTDPLKLQKQVDFLETNKEYSLVCHNVEVIGDVKQTRYINEVKDFYTTEELAAGELSIPTLSVVFRNYKLSYPDFLSNTIIGDFPLFLLIAQNGKIKYFPQVMGVRRVHEGGLWTSADKSAKLSALLTTIYFMIGNYREDINKALIKYHLKLVAESIKEGISIDLYPKEMVWVVKIMSYYKKTKAFVSGFGLIKLVKFISQIFNK